MKEGSQASRGTGLFLALVLFAVGVAAIPARIFVGDPYTWREEAINLILFHRLSVPDGIAISYGERNQYFTQNPVTKVWYSKYGVMCGLLNVVPLYAELALTGKLPAWDSPQRRLYLGFFYAVLGALVGYLLFLTCGHYGVPPAAGVLFTLLAIFSTYLGYYLRASNSEAYQVLFFAWFFERAAAYRAGGFRGHRLLAPAWLSLFCLVHVKVSHLMVVAVFAAALFSRDWLAGLRGRALLRAAAVRIFLPVALITLSAAGMSYWKFGSPFGTGYTMWSAEMFVHNIPPWTIFRNLFLDPQWNIPVHFPLLLLAPFGAREFCRRFPFDAALGVGVFLAAFALIGSMPVWRGEWSYGPRYFLFVLPALSLPALLCLARFLRVEERRRPAVGALLAVTATVAAFSAYLQFEVARLDPFFCYYIRPEPQAFDAEVRSSLDRVPFAWLTHVAWSLRERPDELPWMRRMKATLPPERYAAEKERIELWLKRTNFYWWSPRED